MSSRHSRTLFQTFKYVVYCLLAFNIYAFWAEESLATLVQFPEGVALANIIDAYASTIDTFAWVVLLLMFELETFILEDHHYNRVVSGALQFVRAICYAFILYAFYGYVVNLSFVNQAIPLVGVSDLCSLATNGWSYPVDLDEYTAITLSNCREFSTAETFQRFAGISAVVDVDGLSAIRNLAWVDVINAATWLMVVGILEIDVWLQERNRYEGMLLRISNGIKVVLYGILLLAAIYWGFKGDFIDFWDAFLWLVAFVFIELNVFEWRQEIKESAGFSQNPSQS